MTRGGEHPGSAAPRVSVVLPTYRRSHLLGRAVSSVVAQTCGDWELIVIEDGEPDPATAEVLAAFLGDGRIRHVRNSRSKGEAGNTNTGLLLARGRWIKLLHDDDVMLPGCLERMARVAEACDGTALVACCARVMTEGEPGGGAEGRAGRAERAGVHRVAQSDAHLAMYVQDLDIGIPSQVLVRGGAVRAGARGALMPEDGRVVAGLDARWYARVLQHGDAVIMGEVLVRQHRGHGPSVSGMFTDELRLRDGMVIREELRSMMADASRAPSVEAVRGLLRLIRASGRLVAGDVRGAVVLARDVRDPVAWRMGLRWMGSRVMPAWFRAVPRERVRVGERASG